MSDARSNAVAVGTAGKAWFATTADSWSAGSASDARTDGLNALASNGGSTARATPSRNEWPGSCFARGSKTIRMSHASDTAPAARPRENVYFE